MTVHKFYNQAKYFTSAATLDQLPEDEGLEVAFIGRSNSGKSSAINTITSIKGLARTSKTPGRTQMINLFDLDDERRLVDLPGYGYAKVPRMIQKRWEEATNSYLKTRKCLQGLVVVMDIRHPLKEMDQHIINWTVKCKVRTLVLLTKSDKLKYGAMRKSVQDVETALKDYSDFIRVQSFSSLDKKGVTQVQEILDEWFGL